ncbi:outer membrane protein assembly factor BamE [Pseudoalteromonas sp. NEC-BIFX-2020_002]|uniref:outer membrane protein assembly factor BamE domain-containing protein n=1 Tax=Pseudoalteromonas sp. NEC-BIFX-2020_002 TaxID=2732353 RepID=UPI001476AA60|nr:outer membrane protein assembly factor BamE [Pseudoalteromonas sp. NEC-BIFX-2020_002]NNG41912.1 outer membrane protein assembly factor BamE [Pseudoalteromonas sp. NEC-BIFX-2020_002]
MKKIFLTIVMAFVLTACNSTSQGRDFDMEVVKGFKKGETTQEQVREAIGDPMGVNDVGNDEVVWTYNYSEGQGASTGYVPYAGYVGGSQNESKNVTIRFNAKGIVSGLSFNETAGSSTRL